MAPVKISNVPVPEDRQTRDYHDNFTTFSAEAWQPQNRGFDYFMGFHAAGTAYYNSPSLFRNREHIQASGYISDQLTDARLSYFCSGYKIMFTTMLPYLNAFAELARHGIPLSHIMNIAEQIGAEH